MEQGGLPPVLSPVLHRIRCGLQAITMRGYSEVLSRELQPKVDLLPGGEVNLMDSDCSADCRGGCPTAWSQGTNTSEEEEGES